MDAPVKSSLTDPEELEKTSNIYRYLDELETLLYVVNDIRKKFKGKQKLPGTPMQEQELHVETNEKKSPSKTVQQQEPLVKGIHQVHAPKNYKELFAQYYDEGDDDVLNMLCEHLTQHGYIRKTILPSFITNIASKSEMQINYAYLYRVVEQLKKAIIIEQRIVNRSIITKIDIFKRLYEIFRRIQKTPLHEIPETDGEIANKFFYQEDNCSGNSTIEKNGQPTTRKVFNSRCNKTRRKSDVPITNEVLIELIKQLRTYSFTGKDKYYLDDLIAFLSNVSSSTNENSNDLKDALTEDDTYLPTLLDVLKKVIQNAETYIHLYSKITLVGINIHGIFEKSARINLKTHSYDMKVIILQAAPFGSINLVSGCRPFAQQFHEFAEMFHENKDNGIGAINNIIETARTLKEKDKPLHSDYYHEELCMQTYLSEFNERYKILIITKGDKYVDKTLTRDNTIGDLVIYSKNINDAVPVFLGETIHLSDIIQEFGRRRVKYLVVLDNSCSVFHDYKERLPDGEEIQGLEKITNILPPNEIIEHYRTANRPDVPHVSYSNTSDSTTPNEIIAGAKITDDDPIFFHSIQENGSGHVNEHDDSNQRTGGDKQTQKLHKRVRLHLQNKKINRSRKIIR